MYASDYPHSECQFPNSVDNVLRWSSLKPDTKRKLLWDNATRFYKQTSPLVTPSSSLRRRGMSLPSSSSRTVQASVQSTSLKPICHFPPSVIYSLSCTLRHQTLDDNEWEVLHATRAL